MTDIKLTYFDISASRGEECRLALHLAGLDFIDERVAFDNWPGLRPGTPWGSMPVLTIDGRQLGQTNAILRYIGSEHGLHPKDAWEAARAESAMNAIEDLRGAFNATRSGDDAVKKANREAFAVGTLQVLCDRLEAQIEGPFFSGKTLGVVDLKIYVALDFYVQGKADFVAPPQLGPKLKELMDNVLWDKRVESWRER